MGSLDDVMKSEVIISNSQGFKEKKKKFVEGGAGKFHVLADFDGTLTKVGLPLMKYLRDGNYLSSDYTQELTKLYEKYHPIEIDPNVPYEEKISKMREWWEKVFRSFINFGLDKSTLEKFVKETRLDFREGAKEALKILYKRDIPLVVISSSGLGSVIPMYLKKEKMFYDNISVVANLFEFDKKGIIKKVQEPMIHILNKSEVSIKCLPIYSELIKRKNVLLLGDHLGDLGMVKSFDYNNLISVGFLNENVEENLKSYKNNFDVVLTNDGSFDFVNKFLRDIV